MNDPITDYISGHVRMARDILEGREELVTYESIHDRLAALYEHCGRDVELVHNRAMIAVRQIFGGEPAPPLKKWKVDLDLEVFADMAAEQVVNEQKLRGRSCARSDWRDKLNTRYAGIIERHEAEVQARSQPREAAPPGDWEQIIDAAVAQRFEAFVQTRSAPPGNLEETIAAAVDRAVTTRLQWRGVSAGYSEDRPPPSTYRGVYRPGVQYYWGDECTHAGARWWARQDTDKRPGDGAENGWQLTHKSLEREKARR